MESGELGGQTRKYLTSTIKVLPYSAVTQRGSNDTSGGVLSLMPLTGNAHTHTHSVRVCVSVLLVNAAWYILQVRLCCRADYNKACGASSHIRHSHLIVSESQPKLFKGLVLFKYAVSGSGCHSLAEGLPDHCVVPWRWDNPHCPVGSPGTVPACTLGPGSRKSQLSARNIDPMGRFFCFGPRDPHSCTFFHCQGRRRPERTERRRRGGAANSRGHFGLDRPQITRR